MVLTIQNITETCQVISIFTALQIFNVSVVFDHQSFDKIHAVSLVIINNKVKGKVFIQRIGNSSTFADIHNGSEDQKE